MPEFREDKKLKVKLDIWHDPLAGWNTGKRGETYYVKFDGFPGKLTVGKEKVFTNTDGVVTKGIARPGYKKFKHKRKFDPKEWKSKYGFWPELLFPTAYAESNAEFTSMNFWDKAGFTPGFIQIAAHTDDDLIPFMKLLIQKIPSETKTFFPEFRVINGKLCFVDGRKFRNLEVKHKPIDPLPNDVVDRGLFVSFFNRNRQDVGREERHAAARWLVWTLKSPKMRDIQVRASIDNMLDSVDHLHKALLEHGSSKFPRGVDGMRCDYLAAALAVPHLNPSAVGKAVKALMKEDILTAFRNLEYGPGNRENAVVDGVEKRQVLKLLSFDLSKRKPVLT